MFKKPDYFILASALISLILSIYLWFSGHKEAGIFVGLWVPTVLSFGSYIKALSRRGPHGGY